MLLTTAKGRPVEDVDFLRGVVHVRRQVKTVRYQHVFALPKYDKTRDVPLPEPVKLALAEHIRKYPPREITLPWDTPDGKPTTARLIVTSVRGLAVAANDFDRNYWKMALKAASVPNGRYENGMHELRHFFASVLLDQGESIKGVAEWLGHADPFVHAQDLHAPDAEQRGPDQERDREPVWATA